MIPASGDINLGHVKSELGVGSSIDLSLGHPDVRQLAGKTGSQDISLGDLRGKSTGKNIKEILVRCDYNNGSNSNGSRIGIREVSVYDWKGNRITDKFSWSNAILSSNKSNGISGSYSSVIDGRQDTEYWAYNKSSGDAKVKMQIRAVSSSFVKVKRIVVHWGEFRYSSGHDGSNAEVYVEGSRSYHFYHHRGGSNQPPTTDLNFNE